MNISDLIAELEEFRTIYGDLQVMSCRPGIVKDGDTVVREQNPEAVVLVTRRQTPGGFTPICVVRS